MPLGCRRWLRVCGLGWSRGQNSTAADAPFCAMFMPYFQPQTAPVPRLVQPSCGPPDSFSAGRRSDRSTAKTWHPSLTDFGHTWAHFGTLWHGSPSTSPSSPAPLSLDAEVQQGCSASNTAADTVTATIPDPPKLTLSAPRPRTAQPCLLSSSRRHSVLHVSSRSPSVLRNVLGCQIAQSHVSAASVSLAPLCATHACLLPCRLSQHLGPLFPHKLQLIQSSPIKGPITFRSRSYPCLAVGTSW